MKFLIVALMVISTALLAACNPGAVPTSTEKSAAYGAVEKMEYVKDSRTGLCFGVVTINANRTTNVNVINVPCKDVQSLLGVKSTPK